METFLTDPTPQRAAALAWVAWMISWWLAALWRAPATRRAGAGAEILHLPITIAGLYMIWGGQFTRRFGWGVDALPDWSLPPGLGWALVGLVVLGFLFCWWARLHLGSLWSGNITAKAGHRIVDTGPYALVRHPIYTGLITSAAGTAVINGSPISVMGVAFVILGFTIKARIEERFLREELGPKAYDAYANRVGMLIPGL